MGAFRRRGTLAALSLIFCLPATARETVTWYVDPTFPPGHIAAGRYAGKGIVDYELNWLIGHLPQFDHVIADSTPARSWREVGRADARCNPAALKTPEREKKAVFSSPATMSWGTMLMVRNDRLSAFRAAQTESGNIDFARLIKQTGLNGVADNGRSYGKLVDPLLASLDGRQAVHLVSDNFQGLRMLAAGRADYVLGYTHELNYFRKVESSPEPVTILPIEGVNRYSPGFIACSNQPVGRAVIAAVNAALEQEGAPPPYLRSAEQWFDEKEFREIMMPERWVGP